MPHPSSSLDSFQITEPCFGIFLLGSVRNTAIANVFVSVANMIIFAAGIIEYLKRHEDEPHKIKRDIRPWFWVAYYCYWALDIYLSIILFTASKALNLKKCKKWMWIQIGCFIFFLFLYSAHCFWLKGFQIILQASFGVLSFYKLYTFWVVHSFMKWVQNEPPHMRDLMANMTDADLEEFEHGITSQGRAAMSQSPYDRLTFEINMDHLNDRSKWILLSRSEFGTVYQAVYHKPGTSPVLVAVKTIHAELQYFKTQLCEFKIRTGIGYHEHVVGLIGANTSNIRHRELELILEFCPYGNLENFLQNAKMKGLFLNQLDAQGFFRPVRTRLLKIDNSLTIRNPIESVKTIDLVRWSLHIARGMAYLHDKKVIHGDLATRNVLLQKNQIAKINDFGLSKECSTHRGYVHSKQKRIPWRSMPPECLSDKLAPSFESDVWSYGVTLYEIFTLGDTPYAHLDIPDQRFVYALKNGLQPGHPEFVPNQIYSIMKQCWDLDPKKRPAFKNIGTQLDEFLESVLTENNSTRKPSDEDSGVEITENHSEEVPEEQQIIPSPFYPKTIFNRCSPYKDREDFITSQV